MAVLSTILKEPEKKIDRKRFSVQMIHYSKLIPSEKNLYSVENIRELAEMIRLSGEVKQNLIARKRSSDEYDLIAGHRRRSACIYLVEEMHLEEYAFLPVRVENEDDVMSEINLILTNCGQRERTAYEKMEEVNRMAELLAALQNGDEREKVLYRQICGTDTVSGRALRRIIADKLGLSVTTVANLNHIQKNLSPELKERFEKGDIGISVANVAAGLPPEKQSELAKKERIQITDAKGLLPVSESDTKPETISELPEEPAESVASQKEKTEQTVSESDKDLQYTPGYFLEEERKKLERLLKAERKTAEKGGALFPKKPILRQRIIVEALEELVSRMEASASR